MMTASKRGPSRTTNSTIRWIKDRRILQRTRYIMDRDDTLLTDRVEWSLEPWLALAARKEGTVVGEFDWYSWKMSITLAISFSRPGRSGSFVERDFVFGWALNGKPDGGGGMINSRNVGGIYTGWGGTCTARDERTHSKETALIAPNLRRPQLIRTGMESSCVPFNSCIARSASLRLIYATKPQLVPRDFSSSLRGYMIFTLANGP